MVVVVGVPNRTPSCRAYCVDIQENLLELIESTEDSNLIVTCLAIYTRIILHADRDDPKVDISGATKINYQTLMETFKAALRFSDITVIRAVLDVLATWTSGVDRDSMIRSSLSVPDPTLKELKTPTEVRCFTPHQLADYRKRNYDEKLRDLAWAFERSCLFV